MLADPSDRAVAMGTARGSFHSDKSSKGAAPAGLDGDHFDRSKVQSVF